jgi:beta-lactamase regulating signal transducer with metallopeptidase domain
MKGVLLEQLGHILVGSLWQGAILGAVLMGLLLFIRQPRVRYTLACLTLFAILAWVTVSAVGTFVPAREFTLSQQTSLAEVNPPASETLELPTSTPAVQTPNIQQPSETLRQSSLVQTTREAEPRDVRIFLRFNLQMILPYLSIFWVLGVVFLSLRLLISFYLLERYRKGGVELSEPWVQEKLKTLVGKMNLQKNIKVLQTNTLTTPAVMSVVKPIVLIPSSLVSGLSMGQLELILAHELAHIKRGDYLVNILQTLAETLLFYHPVVWWVSKVIRQERENCCDDLALQITGQSAVEYADVLLRLEQSHQTLALAASNGSLLRRVERLLSPSKASADVRSGVVAFALVLALSLTLVVNAVTAQPIQVSKVPYVVNATIAVDPTNHERIAVLVNKVDEYDCDLEACLTRSLLYTSGDAGKSFQEQMLRDDGANGASFLTPIFDASGNLYTHTTFYQDVEGFDTQTYVYQADHAMNVLKNQTSLEDDRIYESNLFFDEETNTLYLSYLELQEIRMDMWSGMPKLRSSTDGGKTWSDPVNVLEKPTWETNGGRALTTSLFLGEGDELAVVWIQEDYVFIEKQGQYDYTEPIESAPYSIWLAPSEDGGKTFLSPRRIGESWGFISTAYANDVYYIVTKYASYETGEVSLRLLHSKNNGFSWGTANINRNIKLYSSFPYEVAPGLSVTSDGTVDVVFYGQINAPDCISVPAPVSRQWTDKCNYNVYYSSSKDNGTTLREFSDPRPLNDVPILGSQFVRLAGMTAPGWFIGIASTNAAAYPVWIGNREGVEGTQAYMMRIER